MHAPTKARLTSTVGARSFRARGLANTRHRGIWSAVIGRVAGAESSKPRFAHDAGASKTQPRPPYQRHPSHHYITHHSPIKNPRRIRRGFSYTKKARGQ